MEVEGRLRTLEATLRKLNALEGKLGVKLTATATLRGEGGEDEGSIGITLAVGSLRADERAAVLELLEGLETFPEETYLHGSSGVLRSAPFARLRTRLPSHVAGSTLKVKLSSPQFNS